MKKFLFTFLICFVAFAAFSQTYYWVGGTGPVNLTANNNWNTVLDGSGSVRTAASAADRLIFDGSNISGANPSTGTVTTNITSTGVGQIILQGNAKVNFARPIGGGGTGTLTINGGVGDDLQVQAGSTLTVNCPLADGTVVIALLANVTGTVSGEINFSNTGQHRITNQTVGGLVFKSGSNFITNITPASAAYPLGSATQSVAYSVVFENGANLIYNGGFSPFGNNSTFSALDLKPGSNWYHRNTNALTGQGSFGSGKAYGNLLLENSATFNADGPIYRIDDLKIQSGATFNTHTSGQTVVLGDLEVEGSYSAGTGTNVLLFGANGTQQISGTGDFKPRTMVVGDNSNTVLQRDVEIATSLNVFGKINFNNHIVTGAGTFSSRANNSATALNGTLIADSYQITGITGTMGTVNGLTITGAGIPANTTVVGSSPANATINLSQPITTGGTAIALSFNNDTATIVTSNPNGMDSLTGSVRVIGNKNFQSGTNYIINAATSKPFGSTSGSTNDFIHAGFVEINAAVTANKSIHIYKNLAINNKLNLLSKDSIYIHNAAIINGNFSTANYIVTNANSATGEKSFVQYDGLQNETVIPIGSSSNYLPVSLKPASVGNYKFTAFEGITLNGAVDGVPMTALQKQTVVNANWNILRLTGTGSAVLKLNWTSGLEGSTFATLADSEIGIVYNDGATYSLPLAAGDNAANNATATISDFGAFAIGSKPQTEPFIFNVLPSKTYGDADFNGGAVSLNTTQPILYSSDNAAVATIVNGDIHIVGVGTTVITASQASDGFYSAASKTQTLTVEKASLIIKADTLLKFFSEAVPTLTYTFNSFANNETAAVLLTPVTVSTTATAASAVGVYPIIIGGATAANYEISFVNAELTVKAQQTQTITFNALPAKNYGNANFAIGATSTNTTIPLTYTSSNTNVATIVGNNIHIVGAGTSTITVKQAGNVGYSAATDKSQLLTVNKVNLTIRVRDTVKLEKTPNPEFTVTYTGFVLGETVANLTTAPAIVTAATTNAAPGYYVVSALGATSGNYNITSTAGRLTILPLSDTSKQSLNVFMNSASNMVVRVFSPKPFLGDVMLFNMQGQPVYRKNLFMPKGFITSNIDVTKFPAGVYVLVIRGDNVNLKQTIGVVK